GVTSGGVKLTARTPAGLFYGAQTLRQLLPLSGLRRLPAVTIRDYPRFSWRGAMLDVARHFRPVRDVKRFIDLMALYKLNRLHLHLSDDQGWRIAIDSWPRLATHGGSTQVGGGKGGYYTQRQYSAIVRYARTRYVEVVPEIDMPGHVHAALSSYPKLACNGKASPLYTGIEVGFSPLCIGQLVTYSFVGYVVKGLARLTPGPWGSGRPRARRARRRGAALVGDHEDDRGRRVPRLSEADRDRRDRLVTGPGAQLGAVPRPAGRAGAAPGGAGRELLPLSRGR